MTVVFDQSVGRGSEKLHLERKLRELRHHSVYGFAYVSHACFMFVSKDRSLVERARSLIIPNPVFRKAGFCRSISANKPLVAFTSILLPRLLQLLRELLDLLFQFLDPSVRSVGSKSNRRAPEPAHAASFCKAASAYCWSSDGWRRRTETKSASRRFGRSFHHPSQDVRDGAVSARRAIERSRPVGGVAQPIRPESRGRRARTKARMISTFTGAAVAERRTLESMATPRSVETRGRTFDARRDWNLKSQFVTSSCHTPGRS